MLIHTKIRLILAVLAIVTLAAGCLIVRQSHVEHALLPAQQSFYPWRVSANTDSDKGGLSTIDLRENTYNLSIDFELSKSIQYPYASLGLTFDDDEHPERLLNWSAYSSIWFRVKCRPGNVFSFVLYTYEEKITNLSDISTFRPALTFFSCTNEWQDIQVNLHKLEIPEWWLGQHNLNLASRDYHLEQVRGFAISSSTQSPINKQSSVTIEAITLEGRNWGFIYLAIAFGVVVWAAVVYWCFIQLISFRRNNPVPQAATPVVYRQITTEPKHERHKSAVLDYLASEYSNPNLSVETAVSALGTNRAKINDILREETGLTFTAYLNKLRLTEAARLLADKHMGVSEAAFAVGYGSLSYFNRVFKKEYGCAPSAYKNTTIDAGTQAPPENLPE